MAKISKAEKKDKRNRELCIQVKENNLYAQTRLLLENEGLIFELGKKIEVAYEMDVNHYGGIELDDILQEGRFAMLEAAKQYDTVGSVKFSTFAYTIMRNAMVDLCRKGNSSFEKKLADNGIVQVFLNDNPVDDDGSPVCEKVQDGREHDPVGDMAVLHVMLEKMRNRLAFLPEREKRILMYHFGFQTLEFETIERTAAYFHLTEKLISKIEKNALAKLREGMNDGKIV